MLMRILIFFLLPENLVGHVDGERETTLSQPACRTASAHNSILVDLVTRKLGGYCYENSVSRFPDPHHSIASTIPMQILCGQNAK